MNKGPLPEQSEQSEKSEKSKHSEHGQGNMPTESDRARGRRTDQSDRPAWVGWLGLCAVIVLVVWSYIALDLGQWLNLDTLKQSHLSLLNWHDQSPVHAFFIYFTAYTLATAVSLPGATILTLAAGAIFGFSVGLILVSFASSVGALLAFLVARYLLRDNIQRRFGGSLARINRGIEHDGTFYLLTLRLVPLFPFWLINLVMGLTPMKPGRFYLVSQIGMFPATLIYVNAGTQIAALESTAQILSPALLGSLIMLGVFPILARKLVAWAQERKQYARWTRPEEFDRNLIVIGAGAGGLVCAYIAATVKAKVTLIESHRMGGDCLNTGCVPSKALIRTAKVLREISRANSFGIRDAAGRPDFKAVMQRIRSVIKQVEPHDSVERYEGMGVEVIQGYARLISPWEVEVDVGQTDTPGTAFEQKAVLRLCARNIILATGAAPFIPDIPGLQAAGVLTSESVWDLEDQPERLVILGAGPIGCELAQSFARLGSQVTLIERNADLLSREDPEAARLVLQSLITDGVRVLTRHEVVSVSTDANAHIRQPEMASPQAVTKRLALSPAEGLEGEVCTEIECDTIICALGRRPRVEGYGLEELGIELRPDLTIDTNLLQQTSLPNIYAVGDVTGPYQLTHAAAHQAWFAAVNALFGRFRRFRNLANTLDASRPASSAIPRCTFTDPELAQIGLTEPEAIEHQVPYEVSLYGLEDLDRAIADGAAHGFIKVLTKPGKDHILGVTIVGEHAGELLAEFALAMRHGLGLNKILATVHPYPTWSEASKYAAGAWKRAHAPRWLLPWIERLHTWERKH